MATRGGNRLGEQRGGRTGRGPPARPPGGDRAPSLPDGLWRVERTGGLLPPMIRVRKRVRGGRGVTLAGPLLRWPFRLEGRADHVGLIYDPPFSLWVDELRPQGPDLWLGTATLGGCPIGRFRMVRAG